MSRYVVLPAYEPYEPIAPTGDLGWQDRARCAEIGGDAWFPEKGDPTRPAKKICRLCPVATDCLQYAIDNGIWHGVWGGTSAQERRPMINAHRQALEEVAA